MSMASLERAITAEARVVFNNPKLRVKDILEWSTGEIKPEGDTEVTEVAPEMGVYVTISKTHDKRKPK